MDRHAGGAFSYSLGISMAQSPAKLRQQSLHLVAYAGQLCADAVVMRRPVGWHGPLKPPCEKQDYDDNQDDAERADAAMAVAIAVAAEATTEPTEQCDDQDDDEDKSKRRHGGVLPLMRCQLRDVACRTSLCADRHRFWRATMDEPAGALVAQAGSDAPPLAGV